MNKLPSNPALERVNYLYQVAHLTLRETPANHQLVQHYMKTLRYIAQKSVLRLEPKIKRNICKKCSMLLVPGISAIVRTKEKREKHIVVTCLVCKAVKRFPSRERFLLWTDQSESGFMEHEKSC